MATSNSIIYIDCEAPVLIDLTAVDESPIKAPQKTPPRSSRFKARQAPKTPPRLSIRIPRRPSSPMSPAESDNTLSPSITLSPSEPSGPSGHSIPPRTSGPPSQVSRRLPVASPTATTVTDTTPEAEEAPETLEQFLMALPGPVPKDPVAAQAVAKEQDHLDQMFPALNTDVLDYDPDREAAEEAWYAEVLHRVIASPSQSDDGEEEDQEDQEDQEALEDDGFSFNDSDNQAVVDDEGTSEGEIDYLDEGLWSALELPSPDATAATVEDQDLMQMLMDSGYCEHPVEDFMQSSKRQRIH